MKRSILLLFIGAVLATGCKKDNAFKADGQQFSDAKGTKLTLSTNNWRTMIVNSGGEVHLQVSGVTNADKLTMVTAGDGLIGELPITITDQAFNDDKIVTFSVTARQTGTFKGTATLKAYRGSDVLEVPIASGDLHY